MNQTKEKNLSTRLAMWVGGMVIVILCVLVLVSCLVNKRGIDSAVQQEMQARSEGNAFEIRGLLQTADDYCLTLSEYLDQYLAQIGDAAQPQAAAPAATETPADGEAATAPAVTQPAGVASKVYPQLMLKSDAARMEEYILTQSSSMVMSSDIISGCGIYFEPNAFASSQESYAFYMCEGETSSQRVDPGAYSVYSQEDFYQLVKETQGPAISDPYVDPNTGAEVITFVRPVMRDGTFIGCVTADIKVDRLQQLESTSTEYPSLYNSIMDSEGLIVYSKKPEYVGGYVMDVFATEEDSLAALDFVLKGEPFDIKTTEADGRKVHMYFVPFEIGGESWWASNIVDTREESQTAYRSLGIMIAVSAAALVILLVVTTRLLKKSLKPVQSLVAAAEKIAQGDLEIELDYESNDEIGRLNAAFRRTIDGLKRVIADENMILNSMAEGNFDVHTGAEDAYVGCYAPVLAAVRNINYNLSDTLAQINQSSEQVASGSEQVSSGAQALSQGATQQASSVEELAATLSDVSVQINSNAENAKEANAKAMAVGEEMTQSNQKMQEMIQAMEKISSSSSEIAKIIKTIEDIAFQTNILALNAAVEAARAGVAGKGFAVVADEVRNLASKSAEASKNTAALIETSVNAVNSGTRIANDTAQSLLKAVDGAGEVIGLVNQISQASREQAASIDQITQGIDQISSVVQTNSATAEESAAASEELSSQAAMMKQLVSKFRLRESSVVKYNSVPENAGSTSGLEWNYEEDSGSKY